VYTVPTTAAALSDVTVYPVLHHFIAEVHIILTGEGEQLFKKEKLSNL